MAHDDRTYIRLEASETLIAQCLADVLRGTGVVELDGRRVIPMPPEAIDCSPIETFPPDRGYEMLRQATALLVATRSEHLGDYAEILDLIAQAIEAGMTGRFVAIGLRHMGDIHLQCGDVAMAMEFFEQAVQLDPKVGCKRILQALRREHGQ